MKVALRKPIASFLLLSGAFYAAPANACIDIVPFEIADIRKADAVFSGKLVRYEVVKPARSSPYAILSVRPDEVLKGQAERQVDLFWRNSTFGMPDAMEVERPVVVAVVSPDRKDPRSPLDRPDLMRLMQMPCSAPFILAHSAKNIEDIRAILRGKPPPRHSYGEAYGHIRPDSPKIPERPDVPSLAMIALSLIAAGLIGHWGWRKTKR